MDIQAYPKLTALLQEVHDIAVNEKKENKVEILMNILVKYHYWPYIQVKYFSHQSSLVMLHNVYKQDIPIQDKELYDECRSVVLDMNAPVGNNIVLSLSKKIPKRLTYQEIDAHFNKNVSVPISLIEHGYEGTMLYIYYHQERWYVSTSTCPTVDRSRYFNPKKSHGAMMDEALQKMFPEVISEELSRLENSKALRNKFFSYLNPEKTYSFILVHYENGYVMNYSTTFGENYSVLFHLNTRERSSLESSTNIVPELETIGVKYTTKYESIEDAINILKEPTNNIYSIMVHTSDNELYKVFTDEILKKEDDNLGHPNPWMNLLWVYMQNKPHLRMEYYLENHPDVNNKLEAKDSNGNELAPPRVVAKVMTCMRDILYSLYRGSTYYYKDTKTYRMNRVYDQQLPPILRFHLAQLRYLQVNYHSESPLTRQAVHHYLCHHQTMKNVRLLIDALTINSVLPMDQQTADCFYIMNQALKNK